MSSRTGYLPSWRITCSRSGALARFTCIWGPTRFIHIGPYLALFSTWGGLNQSWVIMSEASRHFLGRRNRTEEMSDGHTRAGGLGKTYCVGGSAGMARSLEGRTLGKTVTQELKYWEQWVAGRTGGTEVLEERNFGKTRYLVNWSMLRYGYWGSRVLGKLSP